MTNYLKLIGGKNKADYKASNTICCLTFYMFDTNEGAPEGGCFTANLEKVCHL